MTKSDKQVFTMLTVNALNLRRIDMCEQNKTNLSLHLFDTVSGPHKKKQKQIIKSLENEL